MSAFTGPALFLTVALGCVGAIVLNETLLTPCLDPMPEPQPEIQKLYHVSLSGCQRDVECKLDHQYSYKLEFLFEPDNSSLLPTPKNDQDAVLQVSGGNWQQSLVVPGLEFGKNSTQAVYLQLAHLDNTTKTLEVSVTKGPADPATGAKAFHFCFRLKVDIYTKSIIAARGNDAWRTGDTCVAAGLPCNFKHSICKQVDDEHLCKCNPNMVEYEGRCLVKPGEFCFSSEECVENAICDYDALTCICTAGTSLNATEGTCNGAAELQGSIFLAVLIAATMAKFIF